jgi:osmotically-inducible protein OsmY
MVVLLELLGKSVAAGLPRLPEPIKGAHGAAFRCSGRPGLMRVECELHEGMAVLRGSVPSYYMKQISQEYAKQIQGVEQVVNHLVVTPAS